MSLDVWTPLLTSKACVLASKYHMLNFCETCAAIWCDLWKPKTQDTKWFSVLQKKRVKLKTKKYNNDFRKVVIFNSILDALRKLHTSKYKWPRNKPDDGCLWKAAKRNAVCTSKQLQFVASTKTFNGNQALLTVFDASYYKYLAHTCSG